MAPAAGAARPGPAGSASVRAVAQLHQVRADPAGRHPAHHPRVDRRPAPPWCGKRPPLRTPGVPLPWHRCDGEPDTCPGRCGTRVAWQGLTPGPLPPVARGTVCRRVTSFLCALFLCTFGRRPGLCRAEATSTSRSPEDPLLGITSGEGLAGATVRPPGAGPGPCSGSTGREGDAAAGGQEDGGRCDETKKERAHPLTVSEARGLSKRRAEAPRGRRTDANSRGTPGLTKRVRT